MCILDQKKFRARRTFIIFKPHKNSTCPRDPSTSIEMSGTGSPTDRERLASIEARVKDLESLAVSQASTIANLLAASVEGRGHHSADAASGGYRVDRRKCDYGMSCRKEHCKGHPVAPAAAKEWKSNACKIEQWCNRCRLHSAVSFVSHACPRNSIYIWSAGDTWVPYPGYNKERDVYVCIRCNCIPQEGTGLHSYCKRCRCKNRGVGVF